MVSIYYKSANLCRIAMHDTESSMLYLLLNPPFLPLWSPLAASPASLSTDIAVLKFSSLNSP